MKKLFTLLTLLVFAVGYAAADTYNCADMGGLQTTSQDFTVTFGTYSMAIAKAGGSSAPVYNAGGKDLRAYAKNTVTLSTTGAAFGKVVFNISTQGLKRATEVAASEGSVTVDVAAKTATWTGNATTSVTFTVGEKATLGSEGASKAGQLCFTSIDITTGGGGEETVAKPNFSVAAGKYYSPQTVSITCGTQGATIYYTNDGNDPTTAAAVYNAPINITKTTTLKAMAVKGDKQSVVAEATYEIGTATGVANIAAYEQVEDSTVVLFNNAVNVLAQGGKSLYVKDATGYAFIYGDPGKTYKNGDVIPAGFTGKKITYNGKPELSVYPTDGFAAAAGNSPIAAEEMTTAGATFANFGHYVLIKNARISYENKTITDAAGTAQVRTGLGGYGSSTDPNTDFDVLAIIGTTKNGEDVVPCVYPVKCTPAGQGGGGGDEVDGITIAEFGQVADNANVVFKNAATVVGVSGQRMFVKDETGYMLIYGSTGKTYKQGDIIPAGFGGLKTTYDGEPELKTPFTGFQDASGNVAVTPENLTGLSMMAHANFGHYVVAKNATFKSIDGQNLILTLANGEEVKGFNNMGATLPSDLSKKYDVYAIIGSYGKTNTVYQLLPLNVTVAGGGGIDIPEVADIEALYNLGKGTNAKITGDITAIYQNGNNLYVKSGDTYSLVYGKLTNTFENGDVIKNAVASWTEYQGAKQLTPVDSSFVVASKGAAVEPIEIVLEEVGTDMIHNYLIIKDATITATETANTYQIADETMEGVQMFNKWTESVTIPEDLTKPYDIKCFVTIYKNTLQLYPIAIEGEVAPGIKGDVDGNGTVDMADVNLVINSILGKSNGNYNCDVNGDGAVDMADVNIVINAILGK